MVKGSCRRESHVGIPSISSSSWWTEQRLKRRKTNNEKDCTEICEPGDSKCPFHPLVGGHLTPWKGHLTIPKRSLWITRNPKKSAWNSSLSAGFSYEMPITIEENPWKISLQRYSYQSEATPHPFNGRGFFCLWNPGGFRGACESQWPPLQWCGNTR